jgi:hypothetical protein
LNEESGQENVGSVLSDFIAAAELFFASRPELPFAHLELIAR